MIDLKGKTIRLLDVDQHPTYWVKPVIDAMNADVEPEHRLLKLRGKPANRVAFPVVDKATGAVKTMMMPSEVYELWASTMKRVLMMQAQQRRASAFNRRRRSILARNRHGV